MRLVSRATELQDLCESWRRAPLLCLDTEFVRTRTFFARLGLIQVNDGRDTVLLDTVALDDLSPFGELLGHLEVDVVLHSCSEDLGIFAHELGVLPGRIFDTQVVSSLVGLGFSLSYQALVEVLLGEHVSKGETRSNWTARPLSPAQLRYAALDVEYLPEIHRMLLAELRRSGREEWAREELGPLSDTSRYAFSPEEGWRRVKGGAGLDRRGTAALQGLCTWRDREAVKRDLARNFVVRDGSLLDLAKRRPRTRDELRRIPDLRPDQRRRFGSTLLEILEDVRRLADEDLPAARPRAPRIPQQKEIIRALQVKVIEIGEELGVAPEVLSQKRVLEGLVRRVLGERRDELPAELQGWREEVVGRPLLAALRDHRSGLKLA